MKFSTIFRYEFAYQFRRVWTWLFIGVILFLSFMLARDGSLSEVLYADYLVNSSFSILKSTVVGTLLWLMMCASIAGDAASRDVSSGMHPLLYTTSISKAQYLGGRFLAALAINALMLLMVQVGILLGVYLPGVNPQVVGPFRPAAFLNAYAFLSLPNAFAATAVQFFFALRSGRAMTSYFASFLFFFTGFFIASFLLFQRSLGTLLDPIGMRFVIGDIAHLWTETEKNYRMFTLEGLVLENRLVWTGIALLTMVITYGSFRFAHRTGSSWKRRIKFFFSKRNVASENVSVPVLARIGITASIPIPRINRSFGIDTQLRQMLTLAWTSFRAIAKSWAGIILLVFVPLLTILIVADQMESNGVPLIPTTIQVIQELTGTLSDEMSRWVIIPFLIAYFAGELVWRERDAGLGEITDAMPGSDWVPLLGKFAGLVLMLVAFISLQVVAGILAQAMLNYDRFEVELYLKIMFGLQFPEYLLFAALAFAAHVVANQKYIGHLVAVIAFVFITLAYLFGVEHNLLIYSASPAWSYTGMRGFGASIGPWLWFKLYWAAWALLLMVIARLMWVRGKEGGLRVRFRLARRRFTRPTSWIASMATVLILALAGFIFYNTNILNGYVSSSGLKEWSAGYERTYGKYADAPQPSVTTTRLNVELYPRHRSADIQGSYHLTNLSNTAIDSIHVAVARGIETTSITFNRTAELVVDDKKLYHRIYALKKPLLPGDSLQLDFTVHAELHGFGENGVDPSIAANGTNFSSAWLPTVGYKESRELLGPSERRVHGLAARPVIPSLYDVNARLKRSPGVILETDIGTDEDQVAVAPGALLESSPPQNGRRHFHFVTDTPIGDEWAFFSARYAVRQEEWKAPSGLNQSINIRIYHSPNDTTHLDRMVRSIRASLDYYTKEFGPYPYGGHLTVVERAGNGEGMHADASMITHAEGFVTWSPPVSNPRVHDHPYAVVTHEMGHQWGVPIASVEGAPVMSEGVAWYYGLKAVENSIGPKATRQLLHFMRQPSPYPVIRRGEPLLRGLDPYLSYRKAPFALYALSKYIGDENVNGALRRMREEHLPANAPLATTLDLYGELKKATPDSLQYLLHDLFEVNTFWELATEKVTAEKTQNGTWQVTLELRSKKVVIDSAGVEQALPMDEWIPVGVFAPGGPGDELGTPLYLQMHRIHAGQQTITVSVPQEPVLAGIDPYHLLDVVELEEDDNVEPVERMERKD